MAAAAVVGGPLVGCSSDQAQPSGTTAAESGAPSTAPVPSIPAGATDCGTSNQLSGWPTTTRPAPDAYACIRDAMAAGTPARMVVVSAGQGTTGRTTTDGHDIPARHVTTWLVVEGGTIEQTIDLSEDGGTVTTVTCTGLAVPEDGSTPSGTGCT